MELCFESFSYHLHDYNTLKFLIQATDFDKAVNGKAQNPAMQNWKRR